MSSELSDALEERLEASSSEFRTMRNRILEARILLLVVGLLQIVIAVSIYFLLNDALDDASGSAATLILLTSVAIGVAMLIGASTARRKPVDTLVIAIGGWLAVQIIGFLLTPLSIFQGVLYKLGFLLVLARGLFAAIQAEKMRRELAQQAARYDAAAEADLP